MGIFPKILKEAAVPNGLMILIVHEFSYLKSSISIQSSFKYLSCQWCLYVLWHTSCLCFCMYGYYFAKHFSQSAKGRHSRKYLRTKKNVFAPFTQRGKTRNSLSPKKNSWIQLFSKTVAFTKFLSKKCEREFSQFPHYDLPTNQCNRPFFLHKAAIYVQQVLLNVK